MTTKYDFELLDALFERGQLGSTMPPYILKDVYLDPTILHSLLRTTTYINILRTFLSVNVGNYNIVYKGHTLYDILYNDAFIKSSPFSQREELINWLKINYSNDYETTLFILQDYQGLKIQIINCCSDNPLPMTEMGVFSCWTYVQNSCISELQYSNYTGSTKNYLFNDLQDFLIHANSSYLHINLKDDFLIRGCIYRFGNSQVTLHGNGDSVHNSLFTNLPYKGLTDLLYTHRYSNREVYNYLKDTWGTGLLDAILKDDDTLYDFGSTAEVFGKVADTYRDFNLLFVSDFNVVVSDNVPEEKFEALKEELGQRFNGLRLTNVAKTSPLQIEHISEKMKWLTKTNLGLFYSKLIYLDRDSSNPAVTMAFDELPGHKELYIQHTNPFALLNVVEIPDLVDFLEKELHLSREQYIFVMGDPVEDIGVGDDRVSLSVSAKTSYKDISKKSAVLAARLLMLKEVTALPTGSIYK